MFSIAFEDPVCKWDRFSSACRALLPFLIVCVGWLCLKGCVTNKFFVPRCCDPAMSLFHHHSQGCLTGCHVLDGRFPSRPAQVRPRGLLPQLLPVRRERAFGASSLCAVLAFLCCFQGYWQFDLDVSRCGFLRVYLLGVC